MNTQNSFNEKINCSACKTFYTKRYMSKHQQTLKHIQNVNEFDVEEDIENFFKYLFVEKYLL